MGFSTTSQTTSRAKTATDGATDKDFIRHTILAAGCLVFFWPPVVTVAAIDANEIQEAKNAAGAPRIDSPGETWGDLNNDRCPDFRLGMRTDLDRDGALEVVIGALQTAPNEYSSTVFRQIGGGFAYAGLEHGFDDSSCHSVIWNDCDTNRWHMPVSGGGSVTRTTYEGSLTGSQPITNLTGFSIDAYDVPSLPNVALTVNGNAQDGINCNIPTGTKGCLNLTAPVGTRVPAGRNRVSVGNALSFPNFGS